MALYQADFLAFPRPETPYKVFANPPFSRTSAIVTRLTAGSSPPDDAYLAMPREAAGRFHRADFTPVPCVDVVLLRLRKRGPPLLVPEEAQAYRDFVAHCFTAWRPTLADTLAPLVGPRQSQEILRGAGVDPGAGPAGVRGEPWLDLFARYGEVGDGRAWEVVAGAEGRLREQQARLRKVHRTWSQAGGVERCPCRPPGSAASSVHAAWPTGLQEAGGLPRAGPAAGTIPARGPIHTVPPPTARDRPADVARRCPGRRRSVPGRCTGRSRCPGTVVHTRNTDAL